MTLHLHLSQRSKFEGTAMKRAELKAIIKECLIEILSESVQAPAPRVQRAASAPRVAESAVRRSTAELTQLPKHQRQPQLRQNQIPTFDSDPESAYPAFANESRKSPQQSSKDPYSMVPGYTEMVAAQGDAASIAALNIDPSSLFGGDMGKFAGV